MDATKRVKAEHGAVCSMPHETFGYFGWPSVTRMDDGTLVASASGLRWAHVCPWGKTVMFWSRDEGRTWSAPRVVNDTPLDDRDSGVVSLGGAKLLVTWFALDIRKYRPQKWIIDHGAEFTRHWDMASSQWDEAMFAKWQGSWLRISGDGGDNWSDFIRAPVNTPHGPIRLANGELLYFGKCWLKDQDSGPIRAVTSADDGRTWTDLGVVPNPAGSTNANFCEPHVVELGPGRYVGLVRSEDRGDKYPNFLMFQTESTDGGRTWSTLRNTGIYGSPPHLIRHSSGAVVCTYGYRRAPFGIRAMLSRDEGETWDTDHILRDDGPSLDLGYPCSTELPDGRIFTVYYQQPGPGQKCALLWSCWECPR